IWELVKQIDRIGTTRTTHTPYKVYLEFKEDGYVARSYKEDMSFPTEYEYQTDGDRMKVGWAGDPNDVFKVIQNGDKLTLEVDKRYVVRSYLFDRVVPFGSRSQATQATTAPAGSPPPTTETPPAESVPATAGQEPTAPYPGYPAPTETAAPAQGISPVGKAAAGGSKLEDLQKIKQLLDTGVLTKEEFEKLKKRIINN
ncbi:MAG: SHOCT domain-containing protein, partial [Bacteroidetes bacterium]|nr:SHOCT domain-containing protein [Bacteroidota bacterium]